MNFQKISVLLPTRKRIDRLDRALNSLYGLCDRRDQVEVVLRIDDDDHETRKYLTERGETFIVGPRMRGYASLPHFMNQCAERSSGDVLLMCNDDCVFRTPGWDSKVLDCANRFPDGVFNIGINTMLNDQLFPLSIVSRRLFEALGYINDERLVFSDIFLLDVLETFGRAIRLPTVTIGHEWAGHDHDQTHQDASKHMDTEVFDGTPGNANDPKRNWRTSYRWLHKRAVQEAVTKIHSSGMYQPEMEVLPLAGVAPDIHKHVSAMLDRRFGSFFGSNSALVQYDMVRMSRLLERLFYVENLGRRVLVTPFATEQHLAIWSEFVREVVCIRNRPEPNFENYAWVSNCRVYDIPAGSTHCLFKFRDEALALGRSTQDVFDVLVIEDFRYEVSMVNYYVLRKMLSTRSAAIVFVHGPTRGFAGGFNQRLVDNLRDTKVDGLRHDITTSVDHRTGLGFSLELLGEAAARQAMDDAAGDLIRVLRCVESDVDVDAEPALRAA